MREYECACVVSMILGVSMSAHVECEHFLKYECDLGCECEHACRGQRTTSGVGSCFLPHSKQWLQFTAGYTRLTAL